MTDDRPSPAEGHLRVGTFHRERALTELRNAAADDRITFDELDARVPRALQAHSRDDLVAVLGDLLDSAQLAAFFGTPAGASEGPGSRWEAPVRLTGTGMRAVRLLGPWDVPAFLEVTYSTGGTVLDFTVATAPWPVVDVVLVGSGMGPALVIVPEGWGVDTQGLQVDSTSTVSSSVATRPTGEHPRIILRGRATGSVTVRTPRPRDLRRAERAVRSDPDATRRVLTTGRGV